MKTQEEKNEYARKYYEANKAKVKEAQKKYYEANKEKIVELVKIYTEENKELVKQKHKEYRENNKELIKIRDKNHHDTKFDQRKIDYQLNKELVKQKNKEYRENNKELIKQKRIANKEKNYLLKKERLKTDPLFKLRCRVSNIIYKSLKLKGFKKLTRSEVILGCSNIEFKQHIESLWEPWMNWDNYGNWNGIPTELNTAWDIDHIIPSSTAITEEDVIRLNHYTNLQPLCSYHNRHIKRDSI